MTPTPVRCAVDGGKSGTRLRVLLPDGRVDEQELPGFTHGWGVGVEEGSRTLAEGLATHLAGLGPSHIALGLTSVPATVQDRRRLAALVGRATGARRVVMAGDAIPLHLAGVGGEGVLLSVGTGTIAMALRGGHWWQGDGWGPLLGDRGSGLDLGMRGARVALAARDGAAAPTLLTPALEAALGGLDLASLQAFMSSPHRLGLLADFARTVGDAAQHGDRVAIELCTEAAGELAATVQGLVRRAGLPGDCRIAVTGRVMRSTIVREELARLLERPELAAPSPVDALAGGLALAEAVPPGYQGAVDVFEEESWR